MEDRPDPETGLESVKISGEEIRKRKIARAKQLKAEGKIGKISKDVDFEKMFGKDIDEFLEDSEWDIESIDKMS